jgi:hypothetical protein
MASVTAAAVASICAMRPISSGRNARVYAVPIARLRVAVAPAAAGLTANTSRCGDKPPSVPPDMMIATRSPTSLTAQPSGCASACCSAETA